MRKTLITIVIFSLIPTLVFSTQWGSRNLCPGVNTSASDYPQSISPDGGMYKIRDYHLMFHEYNGSYSWSSTEQECSSLYPVACITIDPTRTEGYAVDNEIWYVTSTDGINWTKGSSLDEWDRPGHYPTAITCAWWDSQQWLYVAYEDGVVWGAPAPYDNPEEIDTEGFVICVSVNFSGDYMVISDNHDLFELTGYGNSWSGKTEIDEVNSGNQDLTPVIGKIDAEEEMVLLWSTPGSVGGFDIYYSTGNSTQAIENTSLGVIKSLFE